MSRVSLNKSQYSQYGSRRVRKISTVCFEGIRVYLIAACSLARLRVYTVPIRAPRLSSSGDLIRLAANVTVRSRSSVYSSGTTRDSALTVRPMIYTFVAAGHSPRNRAPSHTQCATRVRLPLFRIEFHARHSIHFCPRFPSVANTTDHRRRKQGRKRYSLAEVPSPSR